MIPNPQQSIQEIISTNNQHILGEAVINAPSSQIEDEIKNIQNTRIRNEKGYFREFSEIICSTILGSGVGYLLGSFVSFSVDLAKEGFDKIQARSESETSERYFNSNLYSVTGLSLGALAGLVSYIVASEFIRQAQERDLELNMVRENLNRSEGNNFGDALSHRQEIRVSNGVNNSNHTTISAQISYANGIVAPHHTNYSNWSTTIVGQDPAPNNDIQTEGDLPRNQFIETNPREQNLLTNQSSNSELIMSVSPSAELSSVADVQSLLSALASPRGILNSQAEETRLDLSGLRDLGLVSAIKLALESKGGVPPAGR